MLFSVLRRRSLPVLTVLIGGLLPSLVEAGKLSGVRNAVRSESRNSDDDDDSSRGGGSAEHSEEGTLFRFRRSVRSRDARERRRRWRRRYWYSPAPVVFVAGTTRYGVPEPVVESFAPPREDAAPRFVPPVVPPAEPVPHLPQPSEEPPTCRFPYADGWDGYLIDDAWNHAGNGWASRLRLEHGFENARVRRGGIAGLIESEGGIGLQAEWNRYTERLRFGRRDRLHIGDANFVVRVFEEEHAHGRAGIGLNWLSDPYDVDLGVNFTAGVDFFPRKPWILSAEMDLGTLGRATMFHGRFAAGATWDRLELFAGYDFRSIDSVTLHGPMLGLRLWF